MTSTLPTTGSPSLATMARIEARRFVRNPLFLVGFLAAMGLLLPIAVLNDDPQVSDLLSWPVLPAFFIGLPSLLAMARQTRSTDSAAEALGSAPGTEARRTLALAIACLVPFAAGLVWLAAMLLITVTHDVHADEWWFHTASDLHVGSVLLALVPVAGLGGGLLGLLTGRWLRFPGSSVVVLVATVFVCILTDAVTDTDRAEIRLVVPWTLFHSGTFDDGTQRLYEGNATAYLGYLLCLCAAAVLAAVWHDRTARTARLKVIFAAAVVVGLACLALAATTGIEETLVSDPIPWKVAE
ncbi:MAG: hypothetical protein ACRDO4_18320 [Nocardioides sp.]